MHGCSRSILGISLLLAFLVVACADAPPPQPEAPVAYSASASADFDATTAGTIRGRVHWNGPIPSVQAVSERIHLVQDGGILVVRDNPHVPEIDGSTHGVANAVVFLRGIDPRRGRPWDHPPVRIEHRDYRLHVVQGQDDSRTGFVRHREMIEMVSRQEVFHSLRAGGAAFFSLTFPDPDSSLTRRLDRKGIVELTSAAGFYWMRAHLFVDDHPYYTRTDREGRFTLGQVPRGSYEVVCWMPNWNVEREERNPDTFYVTRWYFRQPLAMVHSVSVEASAERGMEFAISAEMFEGTGK